MKDIEGKKFDLGQMKRGSIKPYRFEYILLSCPIQSEKRRAVSDNRQAREEEGMEGRPQRSVLIKAVGVTRVHR